MVVGAHQHEIPQLRGAAVRPMADMVALTVPGRPMTPRESTAAVTQVEGVPDPGGNQAPQAPNIKGLAAGAQHRGNDLAVAGVDPGLGRGDCSGITKEGG